MPLTPRIANYHRQRGQILVFFAIALVVLIAFVGMGVDFGYAYLTRAKMAKALDAAALAGIRNYSSGNVNAIVTDTFSANYGPNAPVPTVTIGLNGQGFRSVDVTASSTINTYFIRVLPGFQTLTVGTSSEAVRAPLYMTLILDRSGSMADFQPGGCTGEQALKGTNGCLGVVANFLNNFDDSYDSVGLVSFDGNATQDLSMTRPFKASINAKVAAMNFAGYTFSEGGLIMAGSQYGVALPSPLLAISPAPPAAPVIPAQAAKVIVFFTDGVANTFQDTNLAVTCTSGGRRGSTTAYNGLYNLTGPENSSDLLVLGTDGAQLSADRATCTGTFPSIHGGTKTADNTNARQEAIDRALAVADAIRSSNVTIYSIGEGAELSGTDAVAIAGQQLIQSVANSTVSGAPIISSEPVGLTVIAPTAAQLNSAFQTIANTILYRLSR